MVNTAAEAWGAELVVKVKEPLPSEYAFFREGLVLYTYLHLAPEPELTRALAEKRVSAVAAINTAASRAWREFISRRGKPGCAGGPL